MSLNKNLIDKLIDITSKAAVPAINMWEKKIKKLQIKKQLTR